MYPYMTNALAEVQHWFCLNSYCSLNKKQRRTLTILLDSNNEEKKCSKFAIIPTYKKRDSGRR